MTQADQQSEIALKSVINGLVTAWNRHDARAFAQHFATNADFTNVFGMRAKGREAIAQFHTPIFDSMFRDSRLVATETTVRILRPDVAAIDARWEMTGARDPHGNEWPMRKGLTNLVVTREGASWSVAIMHNMDLPREGLAEAQQKLGPGKEASA